MTRIAQLNANKHSPVTKNAIIGVLLLILVVASIIVAFAVFVSNQQPRPTPRIENRVLLNGTITLDNGVYYIQFIVPKGAFNVQISGDFAVLQGNITVYIMNETSFQNFGSKDSIFRSNYDSGQLTTGNFTATLSSGGTFYLIYDNIDSSQKTVSTEVALRYYLF